MLLLLLVALSTLGGACTQRESVTSRNEFAFQKRTGSSKDSPARIDDPRECPFMLVRELLGDLANFQEQNFSRKKAREFFVAKIFRCVHVGFLSQGRNQRDF